VGGLELEAEDLARGRAPGTSDQAREKMARAAGRLEHACPARTDRPEALEHRGDQGRRGREVAQVPPHVILLVVA
jgi:hypothetical protein